MSDKDFDITAIDSLMNPTDKTDEEISSLISDLGLSFSTQFFKEIYKCISAEGISPSYELLYLFDAIFKASSKDAKNTKISEVLTADKEISLSFLDACKKSEYLGKEASLPISDILKISSDYLLTLDAKAPRAVSKEKSITISNEDGKELICLGLDREKPLRYGYVKEVEPDLSETKEYLPDGANIYLVSANGENYSRLADSREFCELTLAAKTIDKKGILYTLLNICYGAQVNIYRALPELVTAFHGKKIVAVASESEDAFISLAESYDLSVIKVATALDIPSARIVSADGEINIRSGFLRRLFCFEEKLSVKIPSGQIAPTKYEKLFYNTFGSQDKLELTQAIEINNHTVSAQYTKELSFASGMNTVLDSLFALLSKGADRRKTGISIKLCMRRENIANGVSALLGAYRAIMELCLPETNSEAIFSDEDYILCTAFTRKEEYRPFTEDEAIDTKLYLLSFARDNASLPRYMPKFSEIRSKCDYLFDAINVGAVVSVRPVNGTLSDATEGMTVIYQNNNISPTTVAQGFIIEAKPDTKINAPKIGVLSKNNSEETV